VLYIVEESEERRDTSKPQSVSWDGKWILSTGILCSDFLIPCILCWYCWVTDVNFDSEIADMMCICQCCSVHFVSCGWDMLLASMLILREHLVLFRRKLKTHFILQSCPVIISSLFVLSERKVQPLMDRVHSGTSLIWTWSNRTESWTRYTSVLNRSSLTFLTLKCCIVHLTVHRRLVSHMSTECLSLATGNIMLHILHKFCAWTESSPKMFWDRTKPNQHWTRVVQDQDLDLWVSK